MGCYDQERAIDIKEICSHEARQAILQMQTPTKSKVELTPNWYIYGPEKDGCTELLLYYRTPGVVSEIRVRGSCQHGYGYFMTSKLVVGETGPIMETNTQQQVLLIAMWSSYITLFSLFFSS